MVPDKRRLDIDQHSRSFGRKKDEPGQQHGQSVPGLGAASGSRFQVDVQLGGVAVTLENAMMQMVHFTTLRNESVILSYTANLILGLYVSMLVHVCVG